MVVEDESAWGYYNEYRLWFLINAFRIIKATHSAYAMFFSGSIGDYRSVRRFMEYYFPISILGHPRYAGRRRFSTMRQIFEKSVTIENDAVRVRSVMELNKLSDYIAFTIAITPPNKLFTDALIPKRGIGKTSTSLIIPCRILTYHGSPFKSIRECVDWAVDEGLVITSRSELLSMLLMFKQLRDTADTNAESAKAMAHPFVIIDDVDAFLQGGAYARYRDLFLNMVTVLTRNRGYTPLVIMNMQSLTGLVRSLRVHVDYVGELMTRGDSAVVYWFGLVKNDEEMPIVDKLLTPGTPGRQLTTPLLSEIGEVVESNGYRRLMEMRRIVDEALGESGLSEEKKAESEAGEESEEESEGGDEEPSGDSAPS